MWRTKFLLLNILATVILLVTRTMGGITVYTDRTSFEALIGTHVTYTFDTAEGFPAAPGNISSFGPIIATNDNANGGPAYLINFPVGSSNQTLSGEPLSGGIITDDLFITFSEPEYAVGFDLFPYGPSGYVNITFSGSGGTYEVSYQVPSDGMQDNTSVFFALVSTDPISSFYVESFGDSRSQRYKGIDNLTIVPEPSVAGLLSSVAAFGIRRKRTINPHNRRKNTVNGPSVESLENRKLLSTTFSFAGTPSLSVGSNINISKICNSQAEEAIAIDPVDPSKMFMFSNNHDGETLNTMFAAYSTDAGATWNRTYLPSTADSDPTAAFDRFGNLFIAYLDSTGPGGQGITFAMSTDGGQTFGTPESLSSSVMGDQPTVVTGPGPDGDGSVWISYGIKTDPDDSADNNYFQIVVQGTEVSGLGSIGSFHSPETIPVVSPHDYQDFADISIGPTGQVMVAYQDPTSGEGPDTIYTSIDDDGLGSDGFDTPVAATSTNVGAYDPITPDPNRTVDAEAGLAWDINPSSEYYGDLYLVYTDAPSVGSDNTNIFVRSSDDDGSSWSSPVQVNDDDTENSQFLPRIAIDYNTGYIGVSWYDCRNDNGDYTGSDSDGIADDEAQYFATASVDGGSTFLPNVQVSAGTSNHAGTDYFAYGDFSGLAFDGGSMYPCWADNSDSTGDNPDGTSGYDIYTARVELASTGGESICVSDGSADQSVDLTLDPSGTYLEVWENNPDHTGRPSFTATAAAISSVGITESGGDATLKVWGLPSIADVSFDGAGGSGNTVNIYGSTGNDLLVDAVSGVGYEISDSEKLIILTNVANRDFTGDGSSSLLIDGTGATASYSVGISSSGIISTVGRSASFPFPSTMSDVEKLIINAAVGSSSTWNIGIPLSVDSPLSEIDIYGGSGTLDVSFGPSDSIPLPNYTFNIYGGSGTSILSYYYALPTVDLTVSSNELSAKLLSNDATGSIGFYGISYIQFVQTDDESVGDVYITMVTEDDTFTAGTGDQWIWHSESGNVNLVFSIQDEDSSYSVQLMYDGTDYGDPVTTGD